MSKNKKVEMKNGDPEAEQPKGALALTLMYMVTIVILWSWVYQTLIERGVTR
jgi:hypothetical protein